MVPIAHGADFVLLVPVLVVGFWLALTTIRQRREDTKKAEAQPPEDEDPRGSP
ncbi:MAG: hypothetical protein ACRDSN_22365 [Pseudonocardiaceae bacterium]